MSTTGACFQNAITRLPRGPALSFTWALTHILLDVSKVYWIALRRRNKRLIDVIDRAQIPAFAQPDSDTNGTGSSHGFAVSDGDTVEFGRQRVCLFGIDAPEKGQPCDNGHWYSGPLATKALVGFIAGRPVSCHQVDYDHRNDRPVAVCIAGKDDLQALMVSAGWAWADTAFSDQYVTPRDERQRGALAFMRIAASRRGSGGL